MSDQARLPLLAARKGARSGAAEEANRQARHARESSRVLRLWCLKLTTYLARGTQAVAARRVTSTRPSHPPTRIPHQQRRRSRHATRGAPQGTSPAADRLAWRCRVMHPSEPSTGPSWARAHSKNDALRGTRPPYASRRPPPPLPAAVCHAFVEQVESLCDACGFRVYTRGPAPSAVGSPETAAGSGAGMRAPPRRWRAA